MFDKDVFDKKAIKEFEDKCWEASVGLPKDAEIYKDNKEEETEEAD